MEGPIHRKTNASARVTCPWSAPFALVDHAVFAGFRCGQAVSRERDKFSTEEVRNSIMATHADRGYAALGLSLLFPQFDNRRSGAAFLLRSRVELSHVRMVRQQFGDGPLEHSHAVAVYDAHAAGSRHDAWREQ